MANSEELDRYVSDLKRAKAYSDDQFFDLLSRGIELLSLFDREIAAMFGVSRPTVTRWRNRVSSPHPLMRGLVYRKLGQKAQALSRRATQSTAERQSDPRGDEVRRGDAPVATA